MKAIATLHQPTSVIGSVKTTLTEDEDVEFLVVAKSDILEVFSILPDSLRLECSLEIWGRITSLQAVPTEETSQHHLLLLTDHPDPRLLLFEYAQGTTGSEPSLNCLKAVHIYERNARPAEYLNACLVDHRGKVAVACSYTGKLRVLELEEGIISSDFDTSVRELNIISMCFLRTTNARATVLAILFRDYLQRISITSHDLLLSDRELSPSSSSFLPEFTVPDADSNLLIPVPPMSKSNWNINGGVLVLGGSIIAFYPIDRKQKKKNASGVPKASRTPQAEVNWSFFEITAWCQVDAEGTRFLLGDSFGHLALLALDLAKPILNVLFLGNISPPTSLTPLSSQFIYVGSHFGDSQLVHVTADKSSGNGTHIGISETYKNIAPIMDAVVEDIDGSGQLTIVTCSGGESAGSLRIIRNGANFIEHARIGGISNVFGVWPLKECYDDEHQKFLLLSTDMHSHLLELSDRYQVVRSNVLADLRFDTPTLAAANVLNRVISESGKSEYVSGSYLVQVTRDAVTLLNAQTGMLEYQWIPESGQIKLADISPSQICVAVTGGVVVLLNILRGVLTVQNRKVFYGSDGSFSEISALTISPTKKSAKFSSFVVLAFWSTHEVKAYKLPMFEPTERSTAIMPHLPKSLLLNDFGDDDSESHLYLMVGLANATVASMPISRKGCLGEKKVYPLGGAGISLSACSVNNKPAVLASGSRSALFYRSRDTIGHSPVLIKDVTAAASLNTPTYSSSILLSTLDGLVIGRILELDKLHIRTIAMGTDNPIRIAYNSTANLFGVGYLKVDRTLAKGAAAAGSGLKIINAIDFKTTHEFSLEADEEISAIATVYLEYKGGLQTFFAVGSTYYDEIEREPTRGRVLIFASGSSQDQSPYLLASVQAGGAVNALACTRGKLVVAINTSVDIFGFVSDGDSHLVRLSGWNHNYLVVCIVVVDDKIVVGDAVSSLAVLKLEGEKLMTLARDYSPLWPLCIGACDKETILGANNDNNLFSFRLPQEDKNAVLEQDGLYNIDEVVNKSVPGSFDSSGVRDGLQAKNLLFTSTGRILVAIDVNNEISRLLSCLERNMAGCIKGPGEVDHAQWRAPSNTRGRSDAHAAATGFLDGDFLERFLTYPATSSEMARILSGKNEAEKINVPYSQLRTILESLRSMH